MDDPVEVKRSSDGPGDLVGSAEASEILNVERTRISRYVKSGVMPPPVAKLRATTVWLRSDVEDLAESRHYNGPNPAVR